MVGDRVAADFRFGLPPRKAFWNFYARGTYQNMPVFRQHYGFLQPGCFLFKLTREPFDMRKLWNEVFDLVVTASDTRGKSTSFDQRFAVREP